ncbi:MAG: hypothetical protein MJE68_30240 [Proteobacteria bacterium]|nr:hypothetical protein [Pseudomonadota bacterium]
MARSDWAALLAAAVQVTCRHDTRPFLPLEKGLARQTKSTFVVQEHPTRSLYHGAIPACSSSVQYMTISDSGPTPHQSNQSAAFKTALQELPGDFPAS